MLAGSTVRLACSREMVIYMPLLFFAGTQVAVCDGAHMHRLGVEHVSDEAANNYWRRYDARCCPARCI